MTLKFWLLIHSDIIADGNKSLRLPHIIFCWPSTTRNSPSLYLFQNDIHKYIDTCSLLICPASFFPPNQNRGGGGWKEQLDNWTHSESIKMNYSRFVLHSVRPAFFFFFFFLGICETRSLKIKGDTHTHRLGAYTLINSVGGKGEVGWGVISS